MSTSEYVGVLHECQPNKVKIGSTVLLLPATLPLSTAWEGMSGDKIDRRTECWKVARSLLNRYGDSPKPPTISIKSHLPPTLSKLWRTVVMILLIGWSNMVLASSIDTHNSSFTSPCVLASISPSCRAMCRHCYFTGKSRKCLSCIHTGVQVSGL